MAKNAKTLDDMIDLFGGKRPLYIRAMHDAGVYVSHQNIDQWAKNKHVPEHRRVAASLAYYSINDRFPETGVDWFDGIIKEKFKGKVLC